MQTDGHGPLFESMNSVLVLSKFDYACRTDFIEVLHERIVCITGADRWLIIDLEIRMDKAALNESTGKFDQSSSEGGNFSVHVGSIFVVKRMAILYQR